MLAITHLGTTYLISAFSNEVSEHHQMRGWFIAKKQPQTEEEFEYWTRMSRFYANWKVFGCEYAPSIMKEIDPHWDE